MDDDDDFVYYFPEDTVRFHYFIGPTINKFVLHNAYGNNKEGH